MRRSLDILPFAKRDLKGIGSFTVKKWGRIRRGAICRTSTARSADCSSSPRSVRPTTKFDPATEPFTSIVIWFSIVTELVATLPDELAQRAKDAGLLSDSAIRQLLEDAMRRDAGRKLLVIADRVRAAGVAPMSMEEINAELKAVRAARRDAKSQDPNPES